MAFLSGLIGGGYLMLPVEFELRQGYSPVLLIISGLAVGISIGIGTRIGNGCTSGQGVFACAHSGWLDRPAFICLDQTLTHRFKVYAVSKASTRLILANKPLAVSFKSLKASSAIGKIPLFWGTFAPVSAK